MSREGLPRRGSGRGWRCWLDSGCVFACFPPCAPFGLSGKAWRRFFEPISAYQVYAGIGFFVVLGAGFLKVELDCQWKALEVEKYGSLRDAHALPLFKKGRAGMGNVTIMPLGKRLELSLSGVCFGFSQYRLILSLLLLFSFF